MLMYTHTVLARLMLVTQPARNLKVISRIDAQIIGALLSPSVATHVTTDPLGLDKGVSFEFDTDDGALHTST
jgi:hypothetical protein